MLSMKYLIISIRLNKTLAALTSFLSVSYHACSKSQSKEISTVFV